MTENRQVRAKTDNYRSRRCYGPGVTIRTWEWRESTVREEVPAPVETVFITAPPRRAMSPAAATPTHAKDARPRTGNGGCGSPPDSRDVRVVFEAAGPALLTYLECHHHLRQWIGLPTSTVKNRSLGLP